MGAEATVTHNTLVETQATGILLKNISAVKEGEAYVFSFVCFLFSIQNYYFDVEICKLWWTWPFYRTGTDNLL